MKIGYLYCGGCNPRYDRVAFINDLKQEFYETHIRHAAEGECYDLLLLVCGCSAACASAGGYCANEKFTVSDFCSMKALYNYLKEKG